MTKNIRASAPEGAEYFKVIYGSAVYFKVVSGIVYMWNIDHWEAKPHWDPDVMNLHSLSMGGHVFVICLLFVLVPILCFALLG